MRRLILTCEHAGNRIPAAYRTLFHDAGEALASHRGWDPGALEMAKIFAKRLSAPLFFCTYTRLLVEPNRSLGHPRLYSEFTSTLDKQAKQAILRRHYHPHRNRVESWISHEVENGQPVAHLSLHTFTPQLNGQTRSADVGLLYDPKHSEERSLCDAWRLALKELRPDLRVRRNYPYFGAADGFTTALRRRFGDAYVGIELEVNQLWLTKSKHEWRRLKQDLAESLASAWQQELCAGQKK